MSYPLIARQNLRFATPYFYIRFDLFYAFLKSEFSTVQAQIVISCIDPFMTCMVSVKITSVLICFLNIFLHLFFRHAVTFH